MRERRDNRAGVWEAIYRATPTDSSVIATIHERLERRHLSRWPSQGSAQRVSSPYVFAVSLPGCAGWGAFLHLFGNPRIHGVFRGSVASAFLRLQPAFEPCGCVAVAVDSDASTRRTQGAGENAPACRSSAPLPARADDSRDQVLVGRVPSMVAAGPPVRGCGCGWAGETDGHAGGPCERSDGYTVAQGTGFGPAQAPCAGWLSPAGEGGKPSGEGHPAGAPLFLVLNTREAAA
jgi:hypothetical protein